jgi:hypothetical protein
LLRDTRRASVCVFVSGGAQHTHAHVGFGADQLQPPSLSNESMVEGCASERNQREGGGGSRPAVNARRSSAEHLIIIVKRRCAHIQFVLPWRHTAIITILYFPPTRRPPVVEVLVVVMVVMLCFACNRTTPVITTRLHGGCAEPTKTPQELPHPRTKSSQRTRAIFGDG